MPEQGLALLPGFGTKCKVSLIANKMETAKANMVQRMSFIVSTLGRGSVTREGGVGEVAPRARQRGFLLGTAGGGESLSWRVVAGFYWVLLGGEESW